METGMEREIECKVKTKRLIKTFVIVKEMVVSWTMIKAVKMKKDE